jgi:hypothetical protein
MLTFVRRGPVLFGLNPIWVRCRNGWVFWAAYWRVMPTATRNWSCHSLQFREASLSSNLHGVSTGCQMDTAKRRKVLYVHSGSLMTIR